MRLIYCLLPSLFLLFLSCENSSGKDPLNSFSIEDSLNSDSLLFQKRLQSKLIEIKDFLSKNPRYESEFVIMIDMRIPSNKYRLFVVEMDSMKVTKKGLVSHGSGSETGFDDSLKFSNTPNSYCTSLGKYRIGAAYIGNFGRSYRLHGLDGSNNKAFERAVVLHRYSCVPDEEQAYPICNSLGCPMLSENFFDEIDALIKKSKKQVVMEIFY